MRKIVYMLSLAVLSLSAMARDIQYTRPALTLKNDTLTMEFSMNVADVRVNSEQTYAFTPVLREGQNYYAMPPVIVTGKNGDYKMRRSERKMARQFGYDNPYVVIHGRQDNREDAVRYKASVPYQPWMDHASMILLQEGKECCEVDLLNIKVIEPDMAVKTPALPVEFEVCEPCKEMVSFLTPKDEPKVRSEQSTLYIEFPVGKTTFDADYKNNRSELQKLKNILDPLEDRDLVTFKSINVCGYSSPDGSVRTNDRVASQRAESFALNLKGGYNFPQEVLHVTSGGEDWESLVKMLEEDSPAYADKALAVIQKYDNLDVREARLKTTLGTATYRTMMNQYYPRLRRLSVSVDYEVREVLNSEAARLIYTNPKLLSLQEMYRVAGMYQPGTKEYKEVYEIAAATYPEDVIANINAASANIISGDFKKAASYMDKAKEDPRAYNNLGVLAWLAGNTEDAKGWFQKAASVEPEKANANLEKMVPYETAPQK